MNLGIAVLDDRLLLVSHNGVEKDPDYTQFLFSVRPDFNSPSPGMLWELVDQAARDLSSAADKLILAIPAALCLVKRLIIKGTQVADDPGYSNWLAGTQLPGDLANFHYSFIPLRQSFDSAQSEVLFYATPSGPHARIIAALKRQDDSREVIALPEQLGLVMVLEKSIGREDIPQAGIINCDRNSLAVVYVKDCRFNHWRYFPHKPGRQDELSIDVETYLLSRADATESLPWSSRDSRATSRPAGPRLSLPLWAYITWSIRVPGA